MINPNLSDTCIRTALLKDLAKQKCKPRAVIEELRVHNGNAVADVVALFDEAHCYEIKGTSDKIERITIQGTYYNSAFRHITLVTTKEKYARALKIAPYFWGIIVAYSDGERVTLQKYRKPKQNPQFTKRLALLTLWKSEMLTLLEKDEDNRQPREVLAQLIAITRKKVKLSNQICEILLNRHTAMNL